MHNFTEICRGLSETGKLLVILVVISVMAIIIAWLTTGDPLAVLILSGTLIIIWQKIPDILASRDDIKAKVALAALGFFYLLAIGQPQWKSEFNQFLEPILEPLGISPDVVSPISNIPSLIVLPLGVIVIFGVFWMMRDNTAMQEHSVPIDQEFPEKNYPQRFKSFCDLLREDLNKIDRETNWSAEYFTPLDAEVEVQSGNKRLKRVTDLLTAIRSDQKSKVFLVIGDPGSGKSVALRKLCRELLKESERTGKVPLYINLREWQIEQEWTEDNPPTVEALYGFVIANLKLRGDVFVNDFIDLYFKRMFDHGRLFFILDSFDEIPSVLDVSESSWLIDKLSDVIYRFLAGANQSRGILASRIFRRPTDNFDVKTVLEVRPFTEDKIIETFRKYLSFDEVLVQRLFKERPDLVPVARNPFTASLIISYAKDCDNNLPQTQADLYYHYINKKLDSCREKLETKGLTQEQVIQCSIDIADTMLTAQNFGLEAPIRILKQNLPFHAIEEVIDILSHIKLGRIGTGDDKRFSLVHRRFNEYFVVQRLIEQPERVPEEAIPTDSRWRDVLVLYCEVADEIEAKKIANFCWSEIEKVIGGNVDMRDPQLLRMLHCLRFLKEAFRARVDCIEDFRNDLASFVKNTIQNQENLLLKKFAVEAVGLLKDEDLDEAVVLALSLNNGWISEIAIKSCRHLPKISNALQARLIEYVNNNVNLLDKKIERELSFSFKLSNGFSEIDKRLTLKIIGKNVSKLGMLISGGWVLQQIEIY